MPDQEQQVVKKGVVRASVNVTKVNAGIQVTVKSEDFEKFFKDLSDGRASEHTTGKLAGKKYYKLPQQFGNLYNDTDGTMADYSGEALFSSGKKVDAFVMRTVGLTEGVSFVVKMVASEEYLIEYEDAFLRYLKRFFNQHMKPFNRTMKLITEEV